MLTSGSDIEQEAGNNTTGLVHLSSDSSDESRGAVDYYGSCVNRGALVSEDRGPLRLTAESGRGGGGGGRGAEAKSCRRCGLGTERTE